MNSITQRVVIGALVVLVLSAIGPCLTSAYTFDKDSLTANDLQRSADMEQYLAYLQGQAEFPSGFSSAPAKRYKTASGRAGGVSLCLWKVCPAAPWLVAKRSRRSAAALVRLQPHSQSA